MRVSFICYLTSLPNVDNAAFSIEFRNTIHNPSIFTLILFTFPWRINHDGEKKRQKRLIEICPPRVRRKMLSARQLKIGTTATTNK